MDRIVYRFSLDTNKNGVQQKLQGFETAEVMARKLEISLVSGSRTFELPLNNVTALMYVQVPGSSETSVNACQINGDKIYYDVLESDTSVEGTVQMQLKVIETSAGGAERVIVSPRFEMDVWASDVDDDDAEDSPTFTALEDAIATAQDMINSTLVDIEIPTEGPHKYEVMFTFGPEAAQTIKYDTAFVALLEKADLIDEIIAQCTAQAEIATSKAEEAAGSALGAYNNAQQAAASATQAAEHEMNAKYWSDKAERISTAPVTGVKGGAESAYRIGDVNITVENIGAMSNVNPVGTGSFSLNRKEDSTVGDYSFTEGYGNIASGEYSHAEGYNTTASESYAHAEGGDAIASGYCSHSEGGDTTASGYYSHAEGTETTASGDYSHAEGDSCDASGESSHAEGGSSGTRDTVASGDCSHAEGAGTTASGGSSHAEGYETTASGYYSHAEGNSTTASGMCSHAEGYSTTANSPNSHASGWGTTANSNSQFVIGKFNIIDTEGKYAFIIGNGSDSSHRSNALAIKWDGTIVTSDF